MAEATPGPADSPAAGAGPKELTPAQLDLLADMVYRTLKEEILRGRERRGELSARSWR